MVKHVEKLSTELRTQALVNRGALRQGEIQFRKPRARQRSSSDVAECPRNGRTERSRIEPLLYCLCIKRPAEAAGSIGAHRIACVPIAGRVISQLRGEG